jgi:hypothetical protein
MLNGPADRAREGYEVLLALAPEKSVSGPNSNATNHNHPLQSMSIDLWREGGSGGEAWVEGRRDRGLGSLLKGRKCGETVAPGLKPELIFVAFMARIESLLKKSE